MDKNALKKQMMRLETNYGMERFKITKEMFNLWWDMFKDLNEDGIKVSVDEYIRTNEFPPTVASIMKIYLAKDRQRKEISHYLKTKCTWIARWYEKPLTQEEIDIIKKQVGGIPFQDIKQFLDEMAIEAVRYYNESVAQGVKDVTLKKFLEGYKWTQKDN